MMKALLPFVVAVLAGCGQAIAVPPAGDGGGLKLYEAVSTSGWQSVSVLDSRSHAIERTLPLGTPSSAWNHLYSVSGTELIDTDPRTGTKLHALPLAQAYRLPQATISGLPGGLSQNGKWLVLEAQSSVSPPTASHLLVVDTSFASTPMSVNLNGWFQFDAISNDGRRLFLIEYLSGGDYRVRVYTISARQLEPNVVVDKSSPSESMTGVRLMGVPSVEGQWLFSVYARQYAGAFIHVLNLDGSFAYCIDLPGSGYSADPRAFDWSLALSPTGSTLYATNTAMGTAARIETSDPSDATMTDIGTPTSSSRSLIQDVQAKELAANAALVSPDGKTLVAGGPTGVVWVDTATMKVRRHALETWSIWSVALGPDGSTLYALSDQGTVADVPMSSGIVESSFNSGAGFPLAIMRVAAA